MQKNGECIDLYEKTRDIFGNNKEYDFSRQLDLLIIYLALNAAANYKVSGLGFFRIVSEVKKIFAHSYVRTAFKDFKYPVLSKKEKLVMKLAEKNRAFFYTLLLKK